MSRGGQAPQQSERWCVVSCLLQQGHCGPGRARCHSRWQRSAPLLLKMLGGGPSWGGRDLPARRQVGCRHGVLLGGGWASRDCKFFNWTSVPPDAHPWTSFEPNVSGGKQPSVLGRRPWWPECGAQPPQRTSLRRRWMNGGGGTTPSTTPSGPGALPARPKRLRTPGGIGEAAAASRHIKLFIHKYFPK